MKFLIQKTTNNEVRHDFSFHLVEAIDYFKWYDPTYKIDYTYFEEDDTLDLFTEGNYIPVGSVEFVEDYFKFILNIKLKPLLIPESMLGSYYFIKRHMFYGTEEYLPLDKKMFVKSIDKTKTKDGTMIIMKHTVPEEFKNKFNDVFLPKGNYLFSEMIDITSEWRGFVYKNKLVGLSNYSGDFTIFPDITFFYDVIKTMEQYEIPAYTIDVGINKEGTFIIELHYFYSCGLYGFQDKRILPLMFRDTFEYLRIGKQMDDYTIYGKNKDNL